MKRMLLFITLLLIPFLVVAEKYEIEFQSPKMYSETTLNAFYKDGYIFVDGADLGKIESSTLIQYYSNDGNLIKSKEHIGFYPVYIETNQKFIYIVTRTVQGKMMLHKFNENLEIVKTIDFDTINTYSIIDYRFYIKDNKLYFIVVEKIGDEYGDVKYLELDENLENSVLKDDYVLTIDNCYEKITIPDGVALDTIIPLDDGYLLTLLDYRNPISESLPNIKSLRRIDKDFNTVWEKAFPEYYSIENITIINDKTYFIGYKPTDSEHSTKGDLVSLTNNGELDKVIVEEEAVDGLKVSDKQILLSKGTISYCPAADYENPALCRSAIKHTVYSIEYDINTKVAGKGKVVVSDGSFSNKGVIFEVVPEKGYVLSEVKVTDANGNVIKFTDYKFTMPESNVLIEATFVPINPNTNSFVKYFVLVLSEISFVIIVLLPQHKNKVV